MKRTFLLILILLLFVPNKFLIFQQQSIMKKAESIVASLELFNQLIIDHWPTTSLESTHYPEEILFKGTNYLLIKRNLINGYSNL